MSRRTHLSASCAIAAIATLALAACGSEDGPSQDAERGGCAQGPRGPGTLKLRYRVESTPGQPGSFGETAKGLCTRLRDLGLDGLPVIPEGPELVIRVRRRQEADVRAAAMSGTLTFVDWDANASGRSGPDVPFSGGTALFEAVEAASRMKPRAEPTDVAGTATTIEDADRANDTAPAERHYLFGPDRRLLAGPAWSQGGLATARRRAPPGARILTVPRGILVVEAERSKRQPANVARWFVVEDDAELTRAGITDPKAGTDQVEPIVTFGLTEIGRVAFAAVTRRIAERSAQRVLPTGAGPDEVLERLAIILDDRVVSLITIDPRETPQGLDGSTGVQIGGVGTRAGARRLVLLLQEKPLPARLVPLAPR